MGEFWLDTVLIYILFFSQRFNWTKMSGSWKISGNHPHSMIQSALREMLLKRRRLKMSVLRRARLKKTGNRSELNSLILTYANRAVAVKLMVCHAHKSFLQSLFLCFCLSKISEKYQSKLVSLELCASFTVKSRASAPCKS